MSRLIEQTVNKKIELSEEGFLNKNYLRGLWNFYVAYSISLAFLGLTDKNIKHKCLIWKKLLLNPQKADSKRFKELQKNTVEDMSVISNALNFIKEQKESGGEAFGDIYIPRTIGLYSFEYPGED